MIKGQLLIFVLWIFPLVLSAQFIGKEAALEDLRYFAAAVRAGHPSKYQPGQQVDFSGVIDSVAALSVDSIRSIDFRFWIGEMLQANGCIHTSVRKDPLAYYPEEVKYFPFQLELTEDGKVLIAAPLESPYLGSEVFAVNGVAAAELSNQLSRYSAADGNGMAYARALGGYLSSKLIARCLDFPEVYTVETTKQKIGVKAATAEIRRADNEFLFDESDKGAKFKFGIRDSIGLLRIDQFTKDDKQEFQRLFKQLDEQKNCKALILDLRGNGGGNRKTAVALTQELIDRPFSYSMLKPRKLSSRKYLTGKGKFFLFLGRVKYGSGGLFRGRKSEYGRAYRYGYPAGKRAFVGELIVLTDGFTASASTMVTTWLKQYRPVTFVGEQAGGGYNGNNGGSFPMLVLPNSQLEIRFPAYRLILDEDSEQREGIVPDWVIVPTTESIRGRRDLVLEFALGLI